MTRDYPLLLEWAKANITISYIINSWVCWWGVCLAKEEYLQLAA